MSTKVRQCNFGFACLLCGTSIKERKNMRSHMRVRHMKPRQYRCDLCNQIFLNRAFQRHIAKHHPTWVGIDIESFLINWLILYFQCLCIKWTIQFPIIPLYSLLHRVTSLGKIKTGSSWFEWDWKVAFLSELFLYCPQFLDAPDEDLETLMSTKVRQCTFGFACLLCGRSIKEKRNMRSHMRDKHMKPRQYRCDPCNQIFLNRAFQTHIAKHHPTWVGIDKGSFLINW